tara:strand:- start:3861 stop:5753 length:1893 start_codon:yes stop_codon:yes gene_type:complete
MDHGSQLISEIQLYDKYARWLPEEQRRETWKEVVSRVITFFQRTLANQGKQLDPTTWVQLETAMSRKEVLPSMRVVQMAGPALERCHVGAYNCAYLELDGPQSLGELLYILMQGTGVGYSVERHAVQQWPVVTSRTQGPTVTTTIEDSTEGWCHALVTTIEFSMDGWEPQWDFSSLRDEGTWLHTKGGRASGPEPLKQLLATAHGIIRAAAGRQLHSFEIHRLATMCGSIVQVGGVRRAAELALFDREDTEMASCKDQEFWTTYPELAMANNSMVFTDAATDEQIHDLVTHLSSVGSGEPGIFRRDGNIPLRRSPRVFGTNPCGEIILRSRQFCNLSIAVARQEDTLETLQEKTRLATIFGTIQSCLTSFAYLKTEWKQNSEAERLLGVDITGTMDSPLLQAGNPCLASTLKLLLDTAKETNQKIAQQFGIMPSASITCNKPSGNSSQLIASSSGIHPRYADYYIRRLRISARSPLGKRLVSRGIPCSPEVGQGTMDEARVWVFEFPVQSPTGSVTRHHLSATEQLHYWLQWKRHWTEHNPSCTIYVGRQEWVNVESFLKHHWKDIGGLSFLPKDEHTYALAPYEEISKNDYEQRLHALPRSIDLESVRETIDLTTVAQDYACVGNLCEV